MTADALVIGCGPAALAIASALCAEGLAVEALAAVEPTRAWPNTYGVWASELEADGIDHLLEHRWSNCVSYFGAEPVAHQHAYGLFDKARLQAHWLEGCARGGLHWHRGTAASIVHGPHSSCVTTREGKEHTARLVVDTSGHQPVFVQRPSLGPVAYQAAYGIVGRFRGAPVDPGQFVLMDFRSDHLSDLERQTEPPTFLYAMDLGDGVFFVEETSLALAPAFPPEQLKRRLQQRLNFRGVAIETIEAEEHCLFPMNLPLPDLQQRVVGFGGAASMVHPASGYLVGSLLRRAPGVAKAIAMALNVPDSGAEQVAQAAWSAVWPADLVRKRALYQFGLEKLMRFSEPQLRQFFATFFDLPLHQWHGFLANSLTVPELTLAMLRLFAQAPNPVRWGLMRQQGKEVELLWRVLAG
ncbi:lycopene cyclase family protein [Synechococcus sp. CS-1325]|uniref:lycopene beta cyclase n=1 Tax=Synechococcus sp. CS-1325 TaxID=2847979 RepID=UPI000DB6A8D3|nr:lycopene cyclase family protein [Synechococcus sp. CS-1325]MCT0199829.1 lycopene cyclase family protein [Synechococcus sp. CS-1325]PZU98226.1 MAG: lycopene cyclase [Cyanobium sp.]